MAGYLRLTLEKDTDETGELFAEVIANAFAGRGSAWFGLRELAAFAERLRETYPLTGSDPVEIRGGFWNKNNPAVLEEEHLGLSFYPICSRGVVGCRVHISTAVHEHVRAASQHLVTVELQSSYEELIGFSVSLFNLANDKADEATLHAVEI